MLAIGAGGIGSTALPALVGAGVGLLRVVDPDVVDVSNLHRQPLFTSADVGRAKVTVAAERLSAINPLVAIEAVERRAETATLPALLDGIDLVIDGSDNFATRLAVSDAATAAHISLVSAAVARFQGQVGTFTGWLPDRPCYRCFVGDAHDSDDCDTCADQGVLGAMVAMVAAFGALEAIRHITSFGESAAGKLHIIDGLEPRWRTMVLPKDPACRGCRSA